MTTITREAVAILGFAGLFLLIGVLIGAVLGIAIAGGFL